MKKILLTISLLIIVSSKLSEFEFGKEITFDKDNKEFQFKYDKPDVFFVQAIYGNKLDIKLILDGNTCESISREKGGMGFVTSELEGTNYTISLNPGSNDKGTLWVNPSKNEIKFDLNKKFEWKFDIAKECPGPASKLTFVIDKAEKDVTFVFKYNNEIKDIFVEPIKVPNPFQVCHKTDCKDDITTYDFKKGESYKINVKYAEVGNHYVFPSLSFYDKKDNAFRLVFNLWVIYLLLVFIL